MISRSTKVTNYRPLIHLRKRLRNSKPVWFELVANQNYRLIAESKLQ